MFPLTAVLIIPSPSAQAQIVYEGFDPTFPVYNGGVGFSSPWAQGGFNVLAAGYTVSGASLSHPGLQTSGGRVSGGAFAEINGAVRSLAQTMGTDNTTAYVSVLVRPEGTLNDGIYSGFFGLTLNTAGLETLFMGKPGGGVLEEYVIELGGGVGQVSSGASTVVGQPALLVVKAQFRPGNDVFTLFVDPVPGDPEPAVGATKADTDLGIVTAVGIFSSGAFSIDEIRIGPTYAEVTPVSDVIFQDGFGD
jgi:hypothetical protein